MMFMVFGCEKGATEPTGSGVKPGAGFFCAKKKYVKILEKPC